MAISAPTSTTRSRVCAWPEVPPRDSLFRSVLIAVRDALSAGATLDTMAETRDQRGKEQHVRVETDRNRADPLVKAQTGANEMNSDVSEKETNAAA